MKNAMVKIIIFALFLMGLLFTLSLCHASRRGDDQMEPRDMAGSVTQRAAFARYPVPLDDDLQQHIIKTAVEKGVSPALVMAIIQRESNFDPAMIGDNGNSYGLMQIYANQHTDRCIRLDAVNLLDPYKNIEVGVDILAELMDFHKSLEWVLMAYNGGIVYAGEMAANGNVSSYATDVMDTAQRLAESMEVVS